MAEKTEARHVRYDGSSYYMSGKGSKKIIRRTYDAVRNGAVCTNIFPLHSSFFLHDFIRAPPKRRGNCVFSKRRENI